MQRTIRLRLAPSAAQVTALEETSRQFTVVFNAVCAHGWREHLSDGVKLHHATYYPLKSDFPKLVSDLHIQARVKATEAIKSALRLPKNGCIVSQPHSQRCLVGRAEPVQAVATQQRVPTDASLSDRDVSADVAHVVRAL